MALKSMRAQFRVMTVGMRQLPREWCWADIELEVDLARVCKLQRFLNLRDPVRW
jgi:hypothetical protein